MTLTRRNRNGKMYSLTNICASGRTKISLVDKGTSIEVDVDIQRLVECWHDWVINRTHIHNAFPGLSEPQREFLLTGLTEEDWQHTFSTGD